MKSYCSHDEMCKHLLSENDDAIDDEIHSECKKCMYNIKNQIYNFRRRN